MTSMRRVTASAALALLVALAASIVASGLIVRQRLLDTRTYAAALVEARAYDRVYTEILADPELVGITHGLLGDLGVPADVSRQSTALTTNAVRLALPPDRIRAGVETLLDRVLAYVRGDTPAFDGTIDLHPLLDRVDEAAEAHGRTLLAQGTERVYTSLLSYEDAVVELLGAIAAGDVPEWIPVPADDLDPSALVDRLLEITGNADDPELRERVLASLLVDDERAALVAVASDALERRGAAAVARLLEPGGGSLDVLEAIAARAQSTGTEVIGALDRVRAMAAVLGPLPIAIAAGVGVAAGAAAVVVNRGRRRLVVALAAAAFGVATLVTAAVWWFAGRSIAAPLHAAVGVGDGSWGLPQGINAVLDDVITGVAANARTGVVRVVGVLALAAGGLGAGLLVTDGRIRLPFAARRVAVGALGALALAGVGVVARGAVPSASAARACNGAPELCERRYDEVSYAATHNAMSSPDVVRIWPEHDSFLRGQLDAGVRALLIDTHYWPPVESARALLDVADASSFEVPQPVAEVVYAGLGALAAGRPGTFLCHNHCAFGGIEASVGLTEVREFLEDNPNDVVTLIIQDVISPEDTVEVMEDAGLTGYLYPHDHGDQPWPTLGELIDSGTRLVVFAEDAGPPPEWYANAFEAMQETPFLVLEHDRFTCEHGRGDPAAPLFLLNHWVQRVAPDPSDAAVVNAYDFLLSRARECEQERGLLPNFVAVNFYSIGDVIDVVATLNGLDVDR